MARNGADLIEIVVPYSDPVLDGPVIQNASSVPLQNGFSVHQNSMLSRGLAVKRMPLFWS